MNNDWNWRRIIVIFLLTHMAFILSALESIDIELTFKPDEFIVTGSEYRSIKTANLDYIYREESGKPALPYRMIKVLVPYNAVFESTQLEVEKYLFEKNVVIEPLQQLIPTLPDYPRPDRIEPDPSVYGSDQIFPEQVIEFSGSHKISQYKLFSFLVSPFQFHPGNRELYFSDRISFTIYYKLNNAVASERWDSGIFADLLATEVINPNYLDRYETRSPVDPDDIQYLIITSPGLTGNFQPLADWKTQTGIPAEIIDTDYVYSNFTGTSNQLKIKQCIEYYYENKSTIWVLLGGDNTIVPDFDCYGNVNNGGTTDNYMPTDLFYACFDNQYNWNADGDGINGETNDNIDMGPEVILSRTPVRTGSHVDAFVNKTLYYEQDPPVSNFAEDMLISGLQLWNTWGGRSDADWRCEKMWDDYIDPWWDGTHYRFYDTNTDFGGSGYNVTVTNLTNQINSGYNYMFMATHGNQTLWSTESGSYYYSSHALQQTNQNVQGMIATMACITNAFDNSSGYGTDPCLSEGFIRNPNGGCVAYHGSSRYGWGYGNISDNHGPSLQYADYLYYYLFRGEPAENSYKFGAVATQTRIHFIGPSSSYGAFRWLQFTLNTIGDPELDLLTGDPVPITVDAPSSIMIFNSQPVTIQTNTPYAQICLTNNNDVYIYGLCDSNGDFTCTPVPGIEDDIIVTVTAHNRIYQTATITVQAFFPEIEVSVSEISETLEAESTSQTSFTIGNTGQSGSHLVYSLQIVAPDPRSIAGSDIDCGQTEYESGSENVNLSFTLFNNSSDNEWISAASIDFPPGIIVNSSTNFTGGSAGELQTDNSTGNGALVSWYDPNGGWGQIYGGETANASVNVDIEPGFSGDMVLNWTMDGDIWGSDPHSISGSITLTQNGPSLHLLSPNGSEEWGIDDLHQIDWEYSGDLDLVDIKISRNSGSNWSDIIADTSNDGFYEWTVTGPVSEECLIKICSSDESTADVSDAVFLVYQPVRWLSADNASGDIEAGEDDQIVLTFDSSGLETGTYLAEIVISHNAGDDLIIPVELNVSSAVLPEPEIMGTTVSADGDTFILSWDTVPGAIGYHVYSSLDPYAPFPEEWEIIYSGPSRSVTIDVSGDYMFFRVTAEN